MNCVFPPQHTSAPDDFRRLRRSQRSRGVDGGRAFLHRSAGGDDALQRCQAWGQRPGFRGLARRRRIGSGLRMVKSKTGGVRIYVRANNGILGVILVQTYGFGIYRYYHKHWWCG